MLEKCVQLFGTEGRLRFLTGIFRSRFHGENPCVWLRDGRNGGSGFDVRFAPWIYRCVISQMARHLSLSQLGPRLALCHITPGFVYPQCASVFSISYPSRICWLFLVRAFIAGSGRFWRAIRHKLIPLSFVGRLFITLIDLLESESVKFWAFNPWN